MRLIMNQGHEYNVFGRLVRAGEEFETPDNEAVVWIQFGRAHKAPPRNHTIATKVLKAAVEESEPSLEEKQHNKRYNRRDMRAEEK